MIAACLEVRGKRLDTVISLQTTSTRHRQVLAVVSSLTNVLTAALFDDRFEVVDGRNVDAVALVVCATPNTLHSVLGTQESESDSDRFKSPIDLFEASR